MHHFLSRPLAPQARRGVVRFPAARIPLPAVWLVAVALVAACAGPAPTTPPSVNATQVLPSTAGATQAVPTYPLALADDGGTQVTLKALPRSIVSLTPAATETLYALGVGDRLVGKVEDFALYPPEAGSVPDVAKFGSVDVERIVALKADLVIAGGSDFNPPADIARLRSLGIPVLVVYGSKLETALADIDLIGRAVGKPGPAAALVAGLRAAFAQVQSAVKGMPKPRVYYELDATNGYFGPAPDYFGVEMIELAGGAALTSGIPGAFQISEEKIVAFDPEVILLGDAAYGVTVGQVAARPGWAGLAAVRARAIRPVDDVIITRPGPRLGQGLAALALAIHPGLALPSPLGGAFASASPFPSPLPSGSPAR